MKLDCIQEVCETEYRIFFLEDLCTFETKGEENSLLLFINENKNGEDNFKKTQTALMIGNITEHTFQAFQSTTHSFREFSICKQLRFWVSIPNTKDFYSVLRLHAVHF